MFNIGNYAYTLKTLISITNIKMIYVAKAVDYDISYISKWCNNNNLPQKKNISIINRKLAQLFTNEIVANKSFPIVCREFNLINIDDQQDNKEIIQEEIYQILMLAFEISESRFPLKKNHKEETSTVLIGRKRILEYLSETIRTIAEKSAEDIELICTIDIDRILQVYGENHLSPYNLKNIRMFANLGIDTNAFKKDCNGVLNRIYRLLNAKLECEITLFDNLLVKKYNILAIKDKIAFLFSVDQDGDMDIATEIRDIDTVNEIYNQASSKLRITDIILRPAENLSLEQGGFRTKFYTAPEFEFFSVYGFEFFLPDDVVESLSHEAVLQGGSATAVKKLQITWEERFINAEINFLLPKSAVMRYIEKGVMYYTDFHYQTSVEQRRRHVRQIIEHMKKNKKISFYVLDDDYHYPENFFQISVYFNHNKMFLKKNMHSVSNNASRFYVLADERYTEYIKSYFKGMLNKNNCMKYPVEEMEQIVNENEKMMLRMLDLN